MKTLENQVAELRQQIEQLKREIARKPAREANPLTPRHGRFYGVTQAEFTKGGDASLEVEIWIYSATAAEWQATGEIVTDVLDWFLNDDETIEAGTKVRIDWYETTWVLTAVYCSASDDPDVIASLGG